VTLSLGQLMWGWDMERVQDWLGWRFVWWRRLHLLNVQRQISKAVSREAQSIVACKALLAPLLEALLWPVVGIVLLAPQRRAPDPDANRPL
jgi:hypothetical protein